MARAVRPSGSNVSSKTRDARSSPFGMSDMKVIVDLALEPFILSG
jgi:hypothetical protein